MKRDKIIINATSVNGGGAKKRLLKTVSILSTTYDIALIKRASVKIEHDLVKIYSLPGGFESLTRLISDFFYPLILFCFGYKKMYLFGNFYLGFYPGKIIWNLTNVEPFLVGENMKYNLSSKLRLKVLRMLFYVSKKPDYLILQSKFTKKLIKNKINLEEDRLVHVYNGVTVLNEQAEYSSSQYRKNRILFVGQLVRYKRLELIIRQLYKNNVFKHYHLDVAGQLDWDADYVSELKALVKELKIEKNVKFLGEVTPVEVTELYNTSKFLVYASLYDNCPNNILEAFSLGLPVLAWENEIINELSPFGKIVIVTDELREKHLVDIEKKHSEKSKEYSFSWEEHCREISSRIDH